MKKKLRENNAQGAKIARRKQAEVAKTASCQKRRNDVFLGTNPASRTSLSAH
jgi:hypothetical protein